MKYDYIKMVSEVTGESLEKTERIMNNFLEEWGVSYKEYYSYGFYEMTETQIVDRIKKLTRKKEERELVYERVSEKTGMTKKKILAEIKKINRLGIFKIGVVMYDKWELYSLDEETVKERLSYFAKRAELKKCVEDKLYAIDGENLSCVILKEEYDACCEVTSKIMTESLENSLIEMIVDEYPELEQDKSLCRKIALDIEVNKFLLGYSYKEYLLFGFKDKSLDERREFLSRIHLRVLVCAEYIP